MPFIRPDADTSAGNWTGAVPERNLLTSKASGNSATTLVSDAVTPADNSLLVVIALWSDQRTSGWSVPSISGGGLTWTQRAGAAAVAQWGTAYAIWTAPVSTGASMTVTLTSGANWYTNGGSLAVYQVTGHNASDPIGATATLVYSGSYSASRSVAFSSTPAANSLLLAGGLIDRDSALSSDIAIGTGWSFDVFHQETAGGVGVCYQNSTGALASQVNFANVNSLYAHVIAGIEIKSPPLYSAIDETPSNDGDFIVSPAGPVNEVCKIGLSNPGVTPGQPMTVRYRAQKDWLTGTMELRVRLLQGNTQIASWTESNVPTAATLYERTLTGGEFAAISNFNDLFLEFRANYTG